MSTQPRTGSRPTATGFTMVELLIVIMITVLGFIALLRLQIGTVKSASDSRATQGAINLADHVAQTLRLEALQWSPDVATLQSQLQLKFLKNAPLDTTEGSQSAWLLAYSNGATGADSLVTPVGNDATYDSGIIQQYTLPNGQAINASYCVFYRLTWVTSDLMLRADVRITWLRDHADYQQLSQCNPADTVAPWDRVHETSSITVPVVLMRNVFLKQVAS